jgi:hypothetical protein
MKIVSQDAIDAVYEGGAEFGGGRLTDWYIDRCGERQSALHKWYSTAGVAPPLNL